MCKSKMRKLMIYFIIAVIIMNPLFIKAQAEFEIYYKLNLDYDKGNISISSVEIELTREKIENIFGFYVAEVLDYHDEILNLTFFDVPNNILYDIVNPETGKIEDGGEMELEQVSFEIFVPYYENAKEIIIYNENLTELIKKDVSEYSRQRPEEEVLEEDTERRKEVEEEISKKGGLIEKVTNYWWILFVILFILIVILFYSLSKKKKIRGKGYKRRNI